MKAFIVIKQIEGANKKIEEERVEYEKKQPGCWEYGFWENVRDWTNGGKYKKVRDGYAFKHWYRVEECELEK